MSTLPIDSNGYLTDQLLVATHSVNDGCFNKTVIYICVHNAHGAMGVITNMPLNGLNVEALLDELQMKHIHDLPDHPIYFGGPVETNQGFVLHSNDQQYPTTTEHTSGICFSAGEKSAGRCRQRLRP